MPDDSKAAIAKEYGATSLEAMLHDGRTPYLHMERQVPLESPISIRQFRREWFAAVKLLLGKSLKPQDLGVDATGARSYWARVESGITNLDERKWGYRLKVSRLALLAPAVNRIEILAHEAAHLLDYYNKYVSKGKLPSRGDIIISARFDFIDHGDDWQAIYKRFYKKLKAAHIVEADSDYEKHAALLLEKRRQAWADPEWQDGYKARIKDGHARAAKKRHPAKAKPTSTGRVKAHHRRTEKGKSVAVHGYRRKPRRD